MKSNENLAIFSEFKNNNPSSVKTYMHNKRMKKQMDEIHNDLNNFINKECMDEYMREIAVKDPDLYKKFLLSRGLKSVADNIYRAKRLAFNKIKNYKHRKPKKSNFFSAKMMDRFYGIQPSEIDSLDKETQELYEEYKQMKYNASQGYINKLNKPEKYDPHKFDYVVVPLRKNKSCNNLFKNPIKSKNKKNNFNKKTRNENLERLSKKNNPEILRKKLDDLRKRRNKNQLNTLKIYNKKATHSTLTTSNKISNNNL